MNKIMLLFFCLNSFIVLAQDEFEEETTQINYPMFIGATFQTLVPHSTFGNKMNQPGFGGQLEFLINLNKSPFYAGFSSSIANFGNEVFDFTDTEGFDLKWKTNSSLWSSHLSLHFEPHMQSFAQPYINGQVGFNHFFTVSRLVDPNVEEDRTLERYVDDKDWGLSYGGSVGLLIPLDKAWLYMLDIKATYLKGSNSSFYTKRTDDYTVVEDTIEAFSLEESPISMLGLHIGILVFIE